MGLELVNGKIYYQGRSIMSISGGLLIYIMGPAG